MQIALLLFSIPNFEPLCASKSLSLFLSLANRALLEKADASPSRGGSLMSLETVQTGSKGDEGGKRELLFGPTPRRTGPNSRTPASRGRQKASMREH
jgi:hypothetical protein